MTIDQMMNRAIQHHQAGRLGEAEKLYRQVLAQEPRNVDALYRLGMLAKQASRFDAAIALIEQATQIAPNNALMRCDLADLYRRAGRMDDAIAAYRQAIAHQPNFPDAFSKLSIALKDSGQLEESAAAARQAIALRPNFPSAYGNLANALMSLRRFDESIAAFHQAIALQPHFPQAYSNLGNVLREAGRLEEAVVACRQAIAQDPHYGGAYTNLGYAYRVLGQPEQTIAAFRQAVFLSPNDPQAYTNLGVTLSDNGRPDQAIDEYRKAIAIQSDFATAHCSLGYALLLLGDLKAGWPEYEWRWKVSLYPQPRPFTQPQWKGESIAGKTILLHGEQGLGDTLQFIRYLPLVAQRGAKIIIEVQPPLQRLVQGMDGIGAVFATGQTLPPFDLHCPLLSLPLALNTSLETIPSNIPYLFAPHPRTLPKDKNQVGLVWAGSPGHWDDRKRSIPLKEFAALAQIPANFHSLQLGPPAQHIPDMPELQLIDHSAELKDFTDTADLIQALDLVITVDTAVAHLAGAMGKPVWVMLPVAPDWRWLLDREDSPWYPSMRLFRQRTIYDWTGVVARVAEALHEWCR